MHNQTIMFDTEKVRLKASKHKALVSEIYYPCACLHEKFKSRVSRLSEYEMIEISNYQRSARSKNYTNVTPKHCCNFGNDGQHTCQSCEGSTAFEEQCEHLLMCNDENFVLSHFDRRQLRRDASYGYHTTSDNQSESLSQIRPTKTQEVRESSVNDNDDCESTSSYLDFSQN